MTRWNLTLERRYQLAFAGLMALLLLGVLGGFWMLERGIIPSPNAPLSQWFGQEPPPALTTVQSVEVRAQRPPLAPLVEFVQEPAPQLPPAPPATVPSEAPPEPKAPIPSDLPETKTTVAGAVPRQESKPTVQAAELPSPTLHRHDEFPILKHHFDQARDWMAKGKTAPLLVANYYPEEIVWLARKERGVIVAEGELNGRKEELLVLLEQESNPRLIRLDRSVAPNLSASALHLQPRGPLASVAEAVELCFAGRPAKLFFYPTVEVGAAIVQKQFAAIAAAGIEDPETVAVTDGDLVVEDRRVVYVVNSLLLRSNKFIHISDPAAKQVSPSAQP